MFVRRLFLVMTAVVLSLGLMPDARAASLNVVCLGASLTAGRGQGRHSGGVSRDEAYPAQLERILRAKGHNAHVTNEGVAGDTTAGMLSRLDSAVPAGTNVLVLQPGSNDGRRGYSDTAGNIRAIAEKMRARHIKLIILYGPGSGPNIRRYISPDGQHPTAEGQMIIAKWLAARV